MKLTSKPKLSIFTPKICILDNCNKLAIILVGEKDLDFLQAYCSKHTKQLIKELQESLK